MGMAIYTSESADLLRKRGHSLRWGALSFAGTGILSLISVTWTEYDKVEALSRTIFAVGFFVAASVLFVGGYVLTAMADAVPAGDPRRSGQ
jgi:non-ribosomal peptide synthetase component F